MNPSVAKRRATSCELPLRQSSAHDRGIIMAYVRQWNALSIELPAGWLIDHEGVSPRTTGVGRRPTGPWPRAKWSRLASFLENFQGRVEWDLIDIEVQNALGDVWKSISGEMPHALSRAGRMGSKVFPLFSYRVFYRRSFDEDDPIIAGVNIKDDGGRFRVTADVGGEESGEILLREEVLVSRDPQSLTDAVRQALRLIADNRVLIEDALRLGD